MATLEAILGFLWVMIGLYLIIYYWSLFKFSINKTKEISTQMTLNDMKQLFPQTSTVFVFYIALTYISFMYVQRCQEFLISGVIISLITFPLIFWYYFNEDSTFWFRRVQYILYRIQTFLQAFVTLYTLPRAKVDDFLNSYKVFDYEWTKEKELIEEMGPDYYNQVHQLIRDNYSILNNLLALGDVEKMYIPPLIDISKGIVENQNLFERRMAKDLGLQRNNNCLDIGCGRGRVALHMHRITNSNVTGINIDDHQLANAQKYIKSLALQERLCYKKADMNALPLPFPDNSFDGVYQIQAFTFAKDLKQICADVYRILKPGAKFALLDFVMLDAYDKTNPEHVAVYQRAKPLLGAVGAPTIPCFVSALESSGFKILINENASIDGLQAPLIDKADKQYTTIAKLIKVLIKIKVLPPHFQELFARLSLGGQDFVTADRMRLLTTTHYIVAQKWGCERAIVFWDWLDRRNYSSN